jgi:hypothetical protein
LTIASVIGREFDFRLLQTLSGGTTEEQLLRVIDEALAAHVVEESPGGRERYIFRADAAVAPGLVCHTPVCNRAATEPIKGLTQD